ncbi:protein translocase subunit SecD [Aneurinibacillus uraniidurans]|uniref:protein translocase subunit SecD n=1 Tax=Aneurinibacillus uraniidurans TaxID=2966586 RepID=UPI00234BFDAF|nr:protein translocase subunit SecD [Aneurinibacillus sp. B1]WCN36817.1 protein translocase subunit SecD [Aneurinibacillus sp. B1]
MIKWGKLGALCLIVLMVVILVVMTGTKIAKQTTLGLDLRGGFEILYEVSPLDAKQNVTKQLLSDTEKALDKRVNALGMAEPSIQVEGDNRIRVQLAGVTDQERARNLIGKPAHLTFRDMQGNVLMEGRDLAESGAQGVLDSQTQQAVVTLQFKDAKKFADVTQKYVGQPMAIFLDDQPITTAIIKEIIPNGLARIDGQEDIQKAKELAAILNAGVLPVKMKEVFSTSVGAKLGQEALQSGVKAGMIGTLLVFVFMMVYYRMPGVIACITLVAYIYLLILLQNLMGATLTLPGIAAFVLGIGMAVDANIIMYERMKEELYSGKSYLSALRAGSKRSLRTILDANVTSVIGALVLFYFGSSAIRGFAVTLILSIVVSLLTAVAGSRFLLSLAVRSNAFNKPVYYGARGRDQHE